MSRQSACYRYVLANSWFTAQDNLSFIRHTLHKHFLVALKSNRTVALSQKARAQGRFQRTDTLAWSDHTPIQAGIKGLHDPVLLYRQVFTNKDDSTGVLYPACSDLELSGAAIKTIYHKRWRVECFHKILKSHAALAKSSTKRVHTQSNHVFMAIYAALSLEWLRIKQRMNPFALRSKLYLKAIRQAFEELQHLKTA